MSNRITTVEEFNEKVRKKQEKEKKEEEEKQSIIDSVNNWVNDYDDIETAKKKLEENTPNFLQKIGGRITEYEEKKRRERQEAKRIKMEKEQKYQNKKDKRDKIQEEYGFTDEELFKLYNNEVNKADKVYKAYVKGISRLDKVNGRFLASQLVKLEVLNQQNNQIIEQNTELIGQNKEIIKLLKEIAENTR